MAISSHHPPPAGLLKHRHLVTMVTVPPNPPNGKGQTFRAPLAGNPGPAASKHGLLLELLLNLTVQPRPERCAALNSNHSGGGTSQPEAARVTSRKGQGSPRCWRALRPLSVLSRFQGLSG